jgi:hypothetical protein
MKNLFKKIFGKQSSKKVTVHELTPRVNAVSSKSPKDLATERGEPYINIVGMEIDKKNIGQGAFELEWNSLFIAELLKYGYKGKTDEAIVDMWFTDLCRNVVMESFEQEMADPEKRLQFNRRDLGNGRVEVS